MLLNEETIFQVARQIGQPEARRLYLDQVCGPDAGLRARLGALLQAYDEGQSFLEQPALSPATTPPRPAALLSAPGVGTASVQLPAPFGTRPME